MLNPQLLCIGHRGAMGHAPENTLRAIRTALELGARCVEIDVYSVDGHLVVFHDDRLERTTNGSGYLSEQSFEQLRALDAGYGERIPTLEEVCDAIDAKACLNIELKGPDTAAPVAALLAKLIAAGWPSDTFLVSSFNHRSLQAMRQLNPDILLGALICGLPVDDARFATELGAFSVHACLDFVDQRFVDDAHDRGLKVFVYTVDHPDDLARMQRLGVDGVFSNFPERVLTAYSQGGVTNTWTDTAATPSI